MDDATLAKPPCPTCKGTGLVQSYVQWHGPGRPPADSYNPVTTRCPDCPGPKITVYPFPGADAHPDKRGGELCVEDTRVPVARILAELGEEDDGLGDAVGIAENLDLDPTVVKKCLRGLADWLKTQNWCHR